MPFELPNEKKLIAVIIVLIVMIATLYVAIISVEYERGPGGAAAEEEFLIQVGKNVPVTTVPEPNNEPSPNQPQMGQLLTPALRSGLRVRRHH